MPGSCIPERACSGTPGRRGVLLLAGSLAAGAPSSFPLDTLELWALEKRGPLPRNASGQTLPQCWLRKASFRGGLGVLSAGVCAAGEAKGTRGR